MSETPRTDAAVMCRTPVFGYEMDVMNADVCRKLERGGHAGYAHTCDGVNEATER